MSNNIINKVKPVEVGCVVWVDGYKSKVTKITDDGVVGLVLDEGLITEFHYECLLGDISLDNDGDYVLTTEIVPMIGDVIRINEKEYRLVAIDDGVVTLERGDEIRYYSFYDITSDIMDGYWVSSINEQVFSPTVKRKLKVYEVQDNVYLYNSLEELKEIYELLGEPPIQGFYGTDSYENLTDSLQHKHGLVYYWKNWDSEHEYMYKYMKVIQGATFIG
jgi:hypothetical protein